MYLCNVNVNKSISNKNANVKNELKEAKKNSEIFRESEEKTQNQKY